LLVSTTWSTLGVQVPFSTRHSRVTEVPAGTPVMVVLNAFGLVIVAVPDTTLHVPVPITGSAAAMVKVPSLHCSWSGPATAGDGKAWLVRMMSSNVSAHTPLSMVQRRVAEVPGAIPVMVVDGDEGLVMDAVPEIRVHCPVPTIGVLALIRKMLLLHCSISGGPASATSGNALLVRTTWSTLSAQVPFSTRHSSVTDVPGATPVTVVLKEFGLVIVALPDITL